MSKWCLVQNKSEAFSPRWDLSLKHIPSFWSQHHLVKSCLKRKRQVDLVARKWRPGPDGYRSSSWRSEEGGNLGTNSFLKPPVLDLWIHNSFGCSCTDAYRTIKSTCSGVWSNSTVGRTLAWQVPHLNLIEYGPWALWGVIPEHNAGNQSWALLGVPPLQKNKLTTKN